MMSARSEMGRVVAGRRGGNTLRMDLSGVRDRLSRQGIRCTSQREHIFAALCATDRHPTAEELFQAVRVSSPGVSLATVYNTLEVFTSRGLCRRLATPQGVGACRYDADVSDHAHVITTNSRLRKPVPAGLASSPRLEIDSPFRNSASRYSRTRKTTRR